MASASLLAFPAPPSDPGNYGLSSPWEPPKGSQPQTWGGGLGPHSLLQQYCFTWITPSPATWSKSFPPPSCTDREKENRGTCGFQARKKVPFLALLSGARVTSAPRLPSSKDGHTCLAPGNRPNQRGLLAWALIVVDE